MNCPHCGFDGAAEGKYCGRCGLLVMALKGNYPYLIQTLDDGTMNRTFLDKPAFTVGRSHDCDLVISHPSISRRHAIIRQNENVFSVEDLQSKNGSLINNRRIDGVNPMVDGDRVQFGDILFAFELGERKINEPSTEPAPRKEPPANRFQMLLDVSKLINSTLILSDVLENVMDSVMKLTRAQRGFLMIADEKGELQFKVARNLEESILATQQFQISISSVNRVHQSGNSFISVDIDSDSRISSQQSIVNLGLKSVMCVPLKHKAAIGGVIYVDSHNVARGFSGEDLQMLEALADHATIAIENARLVEENNQMFFSTIEALAEAIEKRDPYTGGHTRRVLEISLRIAVKMGLAEREKENLKLAALLHDIGKIGVDDRVLRKQTSLTDEEFQQIRQHPEIGCAIVKHIRKLQDVLPVILMHHEKMDGSGYPFGHRLENIPLLARIVSVADAFDAMVTDRPYRKGLEVGVAILELEDKRGTQFDPTVVAAFKTTVPESDPHPPC